MSIIFMMGIKPLSCVGVLKGNNNFACLAYRYLKLIYLLRVIYKYYLSGKHNLSKTCVSHFGDRLAKSLICYFAYIFIIILC